MSAWIYLPFHETRWQVHPAWHDRLFDAGGLRLAEWREKPLLEVVNDAPHRTIYRIRLAEETVYIKHYPISDWRSRLRQWFRPSKARGEFEKALVIAQLHIPTIEPLAVGESAGGESYLVTRGIGNALPLKQFVEEASATAAVRQRKSAQRRSGFPGRPQVR